MSQRIEVYEFLSCFVLRNTAHEILSFTGKSKRQLKSPTSLSEESPPVELGAGGGCWIGDADVGDVSESGALFAIGGGGGGGGGCCCGCPWGTVINGPAGW